MYKFVRRSQEQFRHTAMASLNLAVSDTVKPCTDFGKAIDILYEITKVIKKVPM